MHGCKSNRESVNRKMNRNCVAASIGESLIVDEFTVRLFLCTTGMPLVCDEGLQGAWLPMNYTTANVRYVVREKEPER